MSKAARKLISTMLCGKKTAARKGIEDGLKIENNNEL